MTLVRFPGETRAAFNDMGDQSRIRKATFSGQSVTPDRAERHSAWWASLAAISETVMGLPLDEERLVDGTWVRGQSPDLFYQPTPDMTWETWIWMQAWALASRGRCYAWVPDITSQGLPTALVPLDDTEVDWRYDKRTKRWLTKVANEDVERWPLGPLFHIGLYVKPKKPQGMSPVENHAETIGVGLAAQQFGAQFFGDGAHPTLLIKPSKNPGPGGAAALLAKFREVVAGSRDPIVVPVGTEIDRWQVAPNESQFLDTMRYSGEDVARILGVRPGKIGLAVSGQNVTYANIADANSDWRMSGLLRYTRTFESALSRLTLGGRTRRLRFNYNEFLRPDAAARAAIYKVFAEVGSLSGTPVMLTNEMRSAEGLAPLPTGDVFVRPGQSAVAVNADGVLVVNDQSMRSESGGYDADRVAAVLEQLSKVVGNVITHAEARSIVSSLGVDLTAGFVPRPPVVRSSVEQLEERGAVPQTHIHLPDSMEVSLRQEPIVVPAPSFTMPAPQVTVNVEPTPVTVNVAPAPVTLTLPPPTLPPVEV